MCTVQLNDSFYSICMPIPTGTTDIALFVKSASLLINFVVALPANAWMVWLIFHGAKELQTSEIHFLSLAVCEILFCLGLPAQLYCMYSSEHVMKKTSSSLGVLEVLLRLQLCLAWTGRPIFQSCICVDRYIAVVHPLIFIRLKPLKYKVAQWALSWCAFFSTVVLSCMSTANKTTGLIGFIPTLCIFVYCYFLVLCSLKKPGPGERVRNDKRRGGDAMKRRAFNIILVQIGCFFVNYLPSLMIYLLQSEICISELVSDFFRSLGIGCGIIQPLFYLHRAGKLSCLKRAVA